MWVCDLWAMQKMAMVRRLACLRMNLLGSWRPQLPFGHSKRCQRFLVTASEGNNSLGELTQRDHQQRLLQVVLVSPQIPVNSGCIARTCAATCVGLHLVEPLGYNIEASRLKRAGLEYWPGPHIVTELDSLSKCKSFSSQWNRSVVVKVHKSWSEFFAFFQQQNGEKRLLAFTKTGRYVHTDVKYKAGDWLLFGSEVDGLPAAAVEQCSRGEYGGGTVRLPMNKTHVRSLNLSTSAGIAVYEALRQIDSHTDYSSVHVAPIQPVQGVNNDGFP